MSSLERVAVIGAGVIGRGVAQSFAESGHHVLLIDHSKSQLDSASREIARSSRLNAMVSGGTASTSPGVLGRIEPHTTLDPVSDAEFVVENVTEDFEVKREVHAELDELCGEDVVIGVNTSAIPITKVASIGASPERVVGIHFMNPVPLMPMVEIIRGTLTSQETIDRTTAVIDAIGKSSIVVSDSPGFVTNRVMMLMVNEAICLLEEGVSTAPDIDRLFKTCFGHKMGPLETTDLIGVDTVLRSLWVIYDHFKDPKYRPAQLMCRMAEAGLLGRKSGQGFYSY